MFEKEMDEILQAIRDSLSVVSHPRFYRTERGFQGEFGAELRNRLPGRVLDDYFVEHEYQKTLKDHGITIRPDLVVHIPYEGSGFASRAEGNCAVIEIKLKASKARALDDFAHIAEMCEKLDYSLGVFINIGSHQTFLDEYQGPHKQRIRAFAIRLVEGDVAVYE